MGPVERTVLARSLGSKWDHTHLPVSVVELPQIEISALVDANAADSSINVRNHVILGFVPDRPDTLLVIRNPLRLAPDRGLSSEVSANIYSTSFWTINFHNLKIISSRSSWAMPAEEFQTLTSCSSAFVVSANKFFQVTCFCPDHEQDSGTIKLLSMRINAPWVPNHWHDVGAACSSTEIVSAVTCFAHGPEYVTVLLRTRCIFFLMGRQQPIDSPSPFWTTDYDINGAKNCAVRAFEFDIFVEQLLTKQKKPFGHNQSAKWSYVTVLDTRDPRESLWQAKSACEQRHHRMNLANGSIFFVGVLGDDLRSILLLTVLIDPTAIEDGYRDHIVLEGKRWTLAEPTTEHPHQVLSRVIDQIHKLPKHDCGITCRRPENDTTVLATYEPNGPKSLQIIKGQYWHITGAAWNNT
ncbi:protein of unknown function [Taphrina deformans PYCC 5710]|uniref:Uncharacterized protein n=1 Tax=Taphrina deformans (strain PYCC 5710 / ATCC 11124 / CBS 356.35 / IMI 108563 / JCM 9778 / NBRC 8474) TaxID=1097556 RepID=R4XHX5_TAPDE|nr:protein of unknown function [Taphrina deformans PYCC 5710]|eukprot:CCG84108.1 protein of unknown function [Taphrina deformans PYCC 5710]